MSGSRVMDCISLFSPTATGRGNRICTHPIGPLRPTPCKPNRQSNRNHSTFGGNVGIGTLSPSVPLAVAGGSSGSAQFGIVGENLSNTAQGVSLKSDSNVALAVGQATSASMGFLWLPNLSNPAAAAGVIYTFGNANPIFYEASYHYFLGNTYFSNNVGVNTTSPHYTLDVNGSIGATDIYVSTNALPDYVFDADYRNAPLSEVAAYIDQNHHLPGMPSAAEAEKNGLSVGEMQNKLLQKVEELTLHMIAAEKRSDDLAQTNEQLAQQNRDLQQQMAELRAQVNSTAAGRTK